LFPKLHHEAGHELKGVEAEGNVQAPGLPQGGLAAVGHEPLKGREHRTRFLKKPASRCAELGAVAVPFKQGRAQILLHAQNLLGQRGLAQVEQLGGASEVELLSQDDERAQFADVHN
jgi:hypothetical protein